MSANVDAMVREGINAYRAGNKEEARTLLLKAVEISEQNEQAWLWLSAVVDTPEDQQTCLENVLMINPKNERAQQGLRILKQKTSGSSTSSASAAKADEDAFANVSFTQTAPPPKPADDDELPSSVEWDMPPTETSSSSSFRKVSEPTPADYDDWVAGLNLNTSGNTPAPPPPPVEPAFSAPFLADDLGDDAFGFDEDPAIPESTSSAFDSGPFASYDNDLPAFNDDDDDDIDVLRSPPPATHSAPTSSRMMSPGMETPSFSSSSFPAPAREDDDFLSDLDSDEDLLEDYDQADMGALDPSEFFAHIPVEIKPTRLPGTKEREPILALLLFILLLAANIGAVALLVMTLIA